MNIYPKAYSHKAHTVDGVCEALSQYPKQLMNTREAMEGWTMEFGTLHGGNGPAGSLSEIYEYYGEATFAINSDDGIVDVERQPNGDWIAL